MVRRRKPPGDPADPPPAQAGTGSAAYAPVLKAGLQAGTARVQEMHQAIAGTAFDHLLRVPGLAVPTRIVQGVHDAITQGVYAAVRHGSGAAMTLAAGAERLVTDPLRVPSASEQTLRGVLNGVFGDTLADAGSALAVQMGLHAGGTPLAVSAEALRGLRPRVALFIHGLACDEHSWDLRSDAWAGSAWQDMLPPDRPIQYGALLEHELDLSAVFLRYNSGLAIEANARELAALLDRAAYAAPQVREWLLIGHSMGGLVARRAHALAAIEGMEWTTQAPLIVCIGSPHQGAPLEQLGHLGAMALNAAEVTRPLGQIVDARSRGIKDLRAGLNGRGTPRSLPALPALRMIYGTLGDAADGAIAPLIGNLLGDGLVLPGSAADDGAAGDVQRVELAGLGHMQLLNHPRVYAEIRRWLGAADMPPERLEISSRGGGPAG